MYDNDLIVYKSLNENNKIVDKTISIRDCLNFIVDNVLEFVRTPNYEVALRICKKALSLNDFLNQTKSFTSDSLVKSSNQSVKEILDDLMEDVVNLDKSNNVSDLNSRSSLIRDLTIGLYEYVIGTSNKSNFGDFQKVINELHSLINSNLSVYIKEMYIYAPSLADDSKMVEISVVPSEEVSVIMYLDLAGKIESRLSFPCIVDVSYNPSPAVIGGIKVC